MSTKVGTYFDLKYAKKWFVRQQGGCSSPDHFEPFSTDLMLDSYMYLYQSDSVKECCCACGRPDGIGTVLHEERDRFLEIKDRLRRLLEHQLTNFRYALMSRD